MSSEIYPVVHLNLNYMDYRWAAPIFDERKRFRLLDRFANFENRLRGVPITASSNITLEKRVGDVFNHIKANGGLINPLIVKQHSYEPEFDEKKYYVVVGNQRLCALRVLQSHNRDWWKEHYPEDLVPCRVCLNADNWTDATEVMKVFPNQKIEGFIR